MNEGAVANILERDKGVLLGVVLDLSGSMRTSIQNHNHHQISRIESLSQAFRQIIEDGNMALQSMEEENTQALRMLMYGFGFASPSEIGDVFSILTHLVEYSKRLQPALEQVWESEVEQMLKQEQVQGDAHGELRDFAQQELKEQAAQAQKQRGFVQFQHWCASVRLRIDAYVLQLRSRAVQYKKVAFITIPLIITLQWILRCPILLLVAVKNLIEASRQQTLRRLQKNADRYAIKLADRVVTQSKKTLAGYRDRILKEIHQAMLEFFDAEAFKIIYLYDRQGMTDVVRQQFDKKKLEHVHKTLMIRLQAIMGPHANSSWEQSISLLKKASKALKIELRWNILKEKTLTCARQVIWEVLEPEINSLVKALARERFIRAALITLAQAEKKETTVSRAEIKDLLKMKSSPSISLNDLPIFGSSPIKATLTRTFSRIGREADLPENKELRPLIVIISDGQPTDSYSTDLVALANRIKRQGIPIICCFITNDDVAHPWLLQNSPEPLWSEAAQLMFSIASSVDEYPQLAEQLKDSRFVVQKQAKLFIQPNHSDYVHNFVKALLLPHQKEYRAAEQINIH